MLKLSYVYPILAESRCFPRDFRVRPSQGIVIISIGGVTRVFVVCPDGRVASFLQVLLVPLEVHVHEEAHAVNNATQHECGPHGDLLHLGNRVRQGVSTFSTSLGTQAWSTLFAWPYLNESKKKHHDGIERDPKNIHDA
jgi:hypothetical protein